MRFLFSLSVFLSLPLLFCTCSFAHLYFSFSPASFSIPTQPIAHDLCPLLLSSIYQSPLLSICQSLYLSRICSLSLSSPVQYWLETSNLLFYLRHSSRIYVRLKKHTFLSVLYFISQVVRISGLWHIKAMSGGKIAFDQLRSRGFLFFWFWSTCPVSLDHLKQAVIY